MEKQPRPLVNTIALVVTVLYGLTIGALAVIGVPNLGTIAAVGALVVAAVWVVGGIVGRRSPTR
jgi:hypothetical protein